MRILASSVIRTPLSSLFARSSSTMSPLHPSPCTFALRRSFSETSASSSSEDPVVTDSLEGVKKTSSLSSSRGQKAVSLLPSYLADARSVSTYSPINPGGALQLGVAESKMLEDWLVPALNLGSTGIEGDAIYYQPTPGREDFRKSMATYIEDMLSLPSGRLDTNGVILGAGCNAVLENLCFTLAEAGEAVMIPTPYYAAFEFDLAARANLHVEPVTTESYHPEATDDPADATRYYPNAASLDAAYAKAQDEGHPPRILLLSHPNNPLGICYPSSVIQECIDWCRDRKVHLISDEIYAGSIYRKPQSGFESVLKLADSSTGGGLGPYIHWVYALSKDFALSGLRVGAAYTENEEILLPMQKLNDLCQISSSTQIWTSRMLQRKQEGQDTLWRTAFKEANYLRLETRCTALTDVLDECNIPYLPATSGLFLWMDFSKFLPQDDLMPAADRERELYLKLVHDFGLLVTPGGSMRTERPGFFRCVFTAATDDEFLIGLERFKAFAAAM